MQYGPNSAEVTSFLEELATWPWLRPQTKGDGTDTDYLVAFARAATAERGVHCVGVRFVTAENAARRKVLRACVQPETGMELPVPFETRASARSLARFTAETRCLFADTSASVIAEEYIRDIASAAAGQDMACFAEWLVIADLVSGSNPYAALAAFWRLGLFPVGSPQGQLVLWAGDELAGQEVAW